MIESIVKKQKKVISICDNVITCKSSIEGNLRGWHHVIFLPGRAYITKGFDSAGKKRCWKISKGSTAWHLSLFHIFNYLHWRLYSKNLSSFFGEKEAFSAFKIFKANVENKMDKIIKSLHIWRFLWSSWYSKTSQSLLYTITKWFIRKEKKNYSKHGEKVAVRGRIRKFFVRKQWIGAFMSWTWILLLRFKTWH